MYFVVPLCFRGSVNDGTIISCPAFRRQAQVQVSERYPLRGWAVRVKDGGIQACRHG